jgi:hypothetical protein
MMAMFSRPLGDWLRTIAGKPRIATPRRSRREQLPTGTWGRFHWAGCYARMMTKEKGESETRAPGHHVEQRMRRRIAKRAAGK